MEFSHHLYYYFHPCFSVCDMSKSLLWFRSVPDQHPNWQYYFYTSITSILLHLHFNNWRLCQVTPHTLLVSFLTSIWDSVDLESMSGPTRSASCSVHTPLQCQAQVSNPLYPHRHPFTTTTPSPPNCLCFAISDVTSAQGCFLSGWGSKQLIQGKSQSVPGTWPSVLRQNTYRGAGSTGWRLERGNNNTASESRQEMRLGFPETERRAVRPDDETLRPHSIPLWSLITFIVWWIPNFPACVVACVYK